jgi:hypothetical protein
MSETMQRYHSKFGGLWIDETDRAAVLARIAALPDPVMRSRVAAFERDGFVVIQSAVPHAAIDAYLAQYGQAAANPGRLIVNVPFGPMSEPFAPEKTTIPGTKVLETSYLLPAGDRLSFAPPIAQFLHTMFHGPALAFQSLHFAVGSTQTIHQDTAYVVVEKEPLKLIASWIALQDVEPGTGELIYFPGGHRMREYLYADGTSKNFHPGRDHGRLHNAHLAYLVEEAARCGFPQQSFLPKKGDVLLWHADLPHGGGQITKPGSTRTSLVTHYCPAAQTPHYFEFLPQENRRKLAAKSGNFYASMYFPPDRFESM